MPDSSPHGSTGPRTVGLCPEPDCGAEFYMPDAKPGDRCPHGHDGDPPALIIYTMAASGSTVQPSTEATRALVLAQYGTVAVEAWQWNKTREVLAEALAIDAPAIHAAGVAQGRAEVADPLRAALIEIAALSGADWSSWSEAQTGTERKEIASAGGEGVWHKDGALAQLRQMAQWARDHNCLAFGSAETVGKIARNIDAALDAIETRSSSEGTR